MDETIRKLALINAQKFKGKANPKAIIGGLVKEHPEAKDDMPGTMAKINQIVAEVNNLSLEEQEQLLLELDPSFKEKQQEKKQERKQKANELPELKGAELGKVVTRIPPEPSKYNHLGHAMSFLINYLYAKKYQGKVLLRFDDTNPEKAAQEYVDAVFEDVENFLGIRPDEVKYASDHMGRYYAYAEQLLDEEKAYVCSCKQEAMALGRREMQECRHRNLSKEENRSLWDRMKTGEFAEGEQVLRLKIDMQHKNAVMRDPVIYRLAYGRHYRQGQQYKVWPMYDFECAIEEGLCNVTHVLRSNEFDSRIELQNHIASLFGFPPVHYTHYGRYNVTGATTQGRQIRALIETGDYIGWDDPRLMTIRALRRRGIVKEAFYELAQKIGLSKTQTNLDFGVIAAINRNLLDKSAKRLFAVRDPVTITVRNIPESLNVFKLSFNPNEEKGDRVLMASDTYYIERADNDGVKPGMIIRLMDALNIKKIDEHTYAFVSESYEEFKQVEEKGALIHFVPRNGKEVEGTIFMPDTSTKKVIIEENVRSLKEGEVVQFERYAFCRLDRQGKDPVFWFTHE